MSILPFTPRSLSPFPFMFPKLKFAISHLSHTYATCTVQLRTYKYKALHYVNFTTLHHLSPVMYSTNISLSTLFSNTVSLSSSLTDTKRIFNTQKTASKITALYILMQPIPVVTQSKVWVCGCSLAGILGSNPARGMNVCLL